MHANITIEPSALVVPGGSLFSGLVNGTLMDAVRHHGRLVFGSKEEFQAFAEVATKGDVLPAGVRAKWHALITHLYRNQRIRFDAACRPPAAFAALEPLRAEWRKTAHVVVISGALAETIDLPDSGIYALPGVPPDVARPEATVESPALNRLRELADNSFAEAGSHRQDYWTEVLAPLADRAKGATLLDRFAFKALWARDRGLGWAGGPDDEHLVWLIKNLDRALSPGSTVRVMGQALPDTDKSGLAGETAKTTVSALQRQLACWKPMRLGAIEVYVAPSTSGARFPHDRHVRFGNSTAISLNHGLDRLAKQRIGPDRMQWQYLSGSAVGHLEERERTAEGLARPSAAIGYAALTPDVA